MLLNRPVNCLNHYGYPGSISPSVWQEGVDTWLEHIHTSWLETLQSEWQRVFLDAEQGSWIRHRRSDELRSVCNRLKKERSLFVERHASPLFQEVMLRVASAHGAQFKQWKAGHNDLLCQSLHGKVIPISEAFPIPSCSCRILPIWEEKGTV